MDDKTKQWLRDWVKECQEIYEITGQGLLGEKAVRPFHYYIQDRQRAELEASSRGAVTPPPSVSEKTQKMDEPPTATTAPEAASGQTKEVPPGPLFVNVGGATWQHRDVLKAMGLLWEPLEQLWHGKLTQEQVDATKALAGIKLKVGRGVDSRDMA